MLSNKDRQELFALSNKIKNKHIIGRENLSDTVLAMLDKALTANELIKIHLGKSTSEEPLAIADKICEKLNASLIKIIGRTIVVYRPKPKKGKE